MVKTIIPKKIKKVYEAALREADRLENEYLPQVEVDRLEFRFDNVKFLEPQCQFLTIKNVGQVPVQYDFTARCTDGKEYCKTWILVTPDTFTIKVVLFPRKCWHCPNECMVTLCKVMQTNFDSDIVSKQSALTISAPKLLGVPVVLYRLVNHLLEYSLDVPDLFVIEFFSAEMIGCIAVGAVLRIAGIIHSVVETLMRFLDTLPEPVVPKALFESCLKHCNDWFMCKKILLEMPECNRNAFLYIIDFLKELKNRGHKNGCTAKSLASLFVPFLLRSDESVIPSITVAKETYKTDCLVQFVQNFILYDKR